MEKKQLINISANLIALVFYFAISFFLSPYIIKSMGVEAYGFINLTNNFVGYFNLITVALNSMAGRFIVINYLKKDFNTANKFYSSVKIANMIISFIVLVPIVILTVFVDRVLKVPPHLVADVRILFVLVFASFIYGLLTASIGIGYFIKNVLYISAIRAIITTSLRALVIFLLFMFLQAKMYYMAVGTLCATVVEFVFNVYYKNKLIPELHMKKSDFEMKSIKILLSAGVWNLIGQLSALLNTGLDLLLTNIFISATSMGILATSKTIPSLIDSIMFTVAGTFSPNITRHFALDNKEGITKEVKNSAIMIGLILNVIIAGVFALGAEFYSLWVPSEDSELLHILSVLAMACIMISVTTVAIYNVFTAYNKVKTNALVTLGFSVLNIIIVVPLLLLTKFEIYAVAGVSTVLAIVRNFCFTLPYATKLIGVKWYTFYIYALKNMTSIIILTLVFSFIKKIFNLQSWGIFIIACLICGLIGYVLNTVMLYEKETYTKVFNKIKAKLGRK